MKQSKQVPMMLSIPKAVRDRLRMLAAEQNLNNPDQVTSASTIAREIVCQHVAEMQATKDTRAEKKEKEVENE